MIYLQPMARIPLTQGQFAVIDDEDLSLVSQYKCHVKLTLQGKMYPYAAKKMPDGKWKCVGLGRLILQAPSGAQVDHADGDTFNNRRANIRICSRSENCRNRGLRADNRNAYKGIANLKGRWYSRIWASGRFLTSGPFDCPEEAARSYDAHARQMFGAYAKTNKDLGLLV